VTAAKTKHKDELASQERLLAASNERIARLQVEIARLMALVRSAVVVQDQDLRMEIERLRTENSHLRELLGMDAEAPADAGRGDDKEAGPADWLERSRKRVHQRLFAETAEEDPEAQRLASLVSKVT